MSQQPGSAGTRPAGSPRSAGSPDPAAPATGSPASPGSPTRRPSTSPTGTSRVGRRERARPGAPKSFVERYRTPLIGAAVVAIIAIFGVGMFSAATTPVFACSSEFAPSPTPAPGSNASPQPGFVQPDMGNSHVALGTQVTYTYCPPASGRHYNAAGAGPIQPRVYSPTDTVNPQGWIHNLEHGGLVLLYRGDSEGATEAGQQALRAFFDEFPPSPVCNFQAGTSVGPVFARFDDMAWPYAALVWGRVMPLESLDTEAILALDKAYGEKTNPEKLCNPSASPSASASGSTGPSASPSASTGASASPSASAAPSAVPSASPSASTAPSPSAS